VALPLLENAEYLEVPFKKKINEKKDILTNHYWFNAT
jgi:hypothetical protein